LPGLVECGVGQKLAGFGAAYIVVVIAPGIAIRGWKRDVFLRPLAFDAVACGVKRLKRRLARTRRSPAIEKIREQVANGSLEANGPLGCGSRILIPERVT
jgi:hypothetical protein